MSDRLDRDELRDALSRADALVGALTARDWPDDALQLVGDAMLMVALQRTHDIESAARRCVLELRDRGWEGDDELATQIESALGWGPTPLLRSLPVELEELAGVLEGDPMQGGGRIDLRAGEVWPQSGWDVADEVGDDDVEDEDDDERWLRVRCEGPRRRYRDMECFIGRLEDQQVADRLARAIQGRGAFRRFKDVLSSWPDLPAPPLDCCPAREQSRSPKRRWRSSRGVALAAATGVATLGWATTQSLRRAPMVTPSEERSVGRRGGGGPIVLRWVQPRLDRCDVV